eukprot:4351657-Prymnesium_polylepis.1
MVTTSPSARRCAQISSSSGPHDACLGTRASSRRHAFSICCRADWQSLSTSTRRCETGTPLVCSGSAATRFR